MEIQPQHLTFADLISKRLFVVPKYQRAYSWRRKQRENLFEDIRHLKTRSDSHFMATLVGLRRTSQTIHTDVYKVLDVVDGQQRITTLVVLLKALQKNLSSAPEVMMDLAKELQDIVVKRDEVSLILLRVNHDSSGHFENYLRKGNIAEKKSASSTSDYELLSAMEECEEFVREWDNPIDLLAIVKNLN
ncbi:MAG: DUF262 domain-containing protein, partial [Pseudomonadota bacterium]